MVSTNRKTESDRSVAVGTPAPHDTNATVLNGSVTSVNRIFAAKAIYFIGAGAGLLLLLGVVLIAMCFYRRRDTVYNVNKEENKYEKTTKGKHFILNANGSVLREHPGPKLDPNHQEVLV